MKVRGDAHPVGRGAASYMRSLGPLLFALLVVLASTSASADEASGDQSALAPQSSKLALELTLVDPQDGTTVNDPVQKVALKVEAVCGTGRCPAKQAKEANKKLRLTATLSGQNVGSLFTKSGTLAKPGGVQMTYTPRAGLPEGENLLVAYASIPKNKRSNQVEAGFTVDTTAPRFLEVEPDDGAVLETGRALITGEVDDAGATVSVERLQESGGTVVSDDPTSFSFEVPLAEGENTFRLLADDPAGNRGEKSLRLFRATAMGLTIGEPAQGSTVAADRIDVKGTVQGPAGTTVKAGQTVASVGPQGNYVAEDVSLVEGLNSVVVQATAPDGRSVQRTLEVTYRPADDTGPPDTEPPVQGGEDVRSERPPGSPVPSPGELPEDPNEVASEVDPATATDTADSTRFLYEGENAGQTGVEDGTIEDKRVAILRGRVLNRIGDPVPGVRITALDHPELGQTLTREDGRFDFAVNGGGLVTLVYEKDLYMAAQRQVEAPWRDYASVEDVVLVGFSRKVTDVDLAGTDEMLVARGSAITDEAGTRQSTVLLPEDTEAEMVLPDGSTQPLPEMDLRATEYTVGEDGPEAMPAALPPASGYTYAVELSVDEAVEAGAEEVRFTEPVYNYVENFLGFPVGTDVPAGYYDRERGEWVPSDDGRAIKVLSVTGGLADLDLDGSGNPASAAALEALGITEEERRKLAGLYEPGQSLWRVPIDHLTPWDYNWPYGPPPDAKPPKSPQPPKPAPEPKPECKGGSIIDCENQILGEDVDVTGAPFSLHYASDGVPGRAASRIIEIPLSGDTLPASARRIELEVEVAGQTFRRSFPAQRDQSHTFTWDGEDAYGRPVNGERTVTYRVGYVYELVYQQPRDFARTFGSLSGVPISGVRGGREITLWQEGESRVASWDYRGLGIGGWTPDVLHRYDPEGRTLRLGNGDRRRADDLERAISTAAGNGRNGSLADGVPATEARLISPGAIAVGPDGSIYFSEEQDNHRVRKVRPDGTISTVAGFITRDYNGGYSGDGGPATAAALRYPTGLALGTDGSLYIADSGNNRVRRVAPDGIITTVAGNGQAGYSGDGGPARDAKLYDPQGLAVGPDGSLFISLTSDQRIRKVAPDGTISTVAGNGRAGYSGDGGPATSASFYWPKGLAVTSDGTLYIADYWGLKVRKVTPDGTITAVAGNGNVGFVGENGPAKEASLAGTRGVAIGPDESLYVTDWDNHRVRAVRSPMPGVGLSDFAVPSEDGSELYQFDHTGRHLRTLDRTTGTVLLRFAYDPQGRLSAVEDMDGLTTTIERDASGNATAIVAPGGARTELSLDANGYLASVANPADESTRLTYDGASGLLRSFADPRDNTTRFSYDSLGRLTRDEDPAGGYQDLSRTDGVGDAFTTSVTQTSGRKNTYGVEQLPNGDSRRFATDANGLTTAKILGADGDERVTVPNGTVVETNTGPDPRFGMQAPVMTQATVRTPGGRSRTVRTTRQVQPVNPEQPLGPERLTETVTVGDRTWTSTFDQSTRKMKSTTPEGRITTTTVDEKGRPVLVEVPGSAPQSYEYDGRGRLTEVTVGTGADARTVTYAYDGDDRVSSITDASGEEWTYDYDAAGRLIDQASPESSTVAYAYDDSGNLTSMTPPGQPTHEFAYDGRGLPTTYTAPSVGAEDRVTTARWDLDSLPTSEALPGGGQISYSHDAGGRPQRMTYPGGEKTYTYNPTTGNIATVANGSGTLAYAFDGILPLSETSTGQVPGRVELRYGADQRLSGMVVNGSEITYAYDRDDLVTRAGSLNVSREAQRGLVTGTALSNTTDAWAYNAVGEPDSYEALSGTTQLYGTAYSRDSQGRITGIAETVGGTSASHAYSYDDAGRLVQVRRDGNVVATYSYDANGNRLSHTANGDTVAGTYDDQDRLTRYGDAVYEYTPLGHLETVTDTQTGATTTYAHDALGNLLSATLPGGRRVEYVVDARDRRVGKKVDGQLVQGFLYAGQLSPVAELDGSGNVVSRFVYATKENVPDYMVKGGTTYRIVSDHRGSVRLVVDASTGAVAQRLDYDEFGNVLQDTNPGFQPFGFAGGLYDRDTDLVRFGARDYDPETGRWVQKDPIGFEGGDTNLYAYVSNDPINWVDPSGLFASVCASGNDIHIDIPLTFTGTGASKEAIDKMLKGIRDHWTGTFGKYNVHVNAFEAQKDPLSMGLVGSGENTINVVAGSGRSFVSGVGGHRGKWFAGDPALGWTAAHEAGHLMGLRDRYTDVGKHSVPHKGWEKNMMAEVNGKVEERNIEGILSKNPNTCKCKKKKK